MGACLMLILFHARSSFTLLCIQQSCRSTITGSRSTYRHAILLNQLSANRWSCQTHFCGTAKLIFMEFWIFLRFVKTWGIGIEVGYCIHNVFIHKIHSLALLIGAWQWYLRCHRSNLGVREPSISWVGNKISHHLSLIPPWMERGNWMQNTWVGKLEDSLLVHIHLQH